MNAGGRAPSRRLPPISSWRWPTPSPASAWRPTFWIIEGEGLRRGRSAAARHGEVDAIVVGGGDGSVRTVASVLAGTSVPLGIIPLGTLNHFAKDLGLPLAVEAAACIAAGRARMVDLAEVNGETFINNSSIGIYPYMVIDRERRRAQHKSPNGWPWCRPSSALRGISAAQFAHLGGELDTALPHALLVRRQQRIRHGAVHLRAAPAPRYRQALVLCGQTAQPLGFFLMVCRLCFGHLDQAPRPRNASADGAEISVKTSRLPVALDGEVKIMHPPLHYCIRPKALRVIVP